MGFENILLPVTTYDRWRETESDLRAEVERLNLLGQTLRDEGDRLIRRNAELASDNIRLRRLLREAAALLPEAAREPFV